MRQQVDPGCTQVDFIQVNSKQTFHALETFHEARVERLRSEGRWLKENRIDLILSDVPSFPLRAGKTLGIPALLIGNFTWLDIYSGLPGSENYRSQLEALREEYAAATLQFLPQCHIANDVVPVQKEVGFICNRGKDIRRELEVALGKTFEDKKIIFIYLGDHPVPSLPWEKLESLKNYLFLTRDPVALEKACENFFTLDHRFSYPDLIASADLVCTKAGYATLATAFSHGKPVISCDRQYFSEFAAMRDFMTQKGVGEIIDSKRFYACDWKEGIKKAENLTVKGKVRLNGELEVMQTIADLIE